MKRQPLVVATDGREILSSVVASQIDIHRKYGGVVPELASPRTLAQNRAGRARSHGTGRNAP